MDKKLLTASALAFLAGAGGVYVIENGKTVQAEVAAEVVELKDADAVALLAEAEKAGVTGAIKCADVGPGSNTPGRCYCTDGDAVGWLTDASECIDKATIVGGKVYVGAGEGKP